MNAKLRKEEVFSQVIGRHSLHNSTNENGEMVVYYATNNDMFVISTNFQHKKIYIGTWTSPDHQMVNQIDVMVSKRKMKMIHDVRVKRGYNCDSDHFLVQVTIQQKLIVASNRQPQNIRWDRHLYTQGTNPGISIILVCKLTLDFLLL